MDWWESTTSAQSFAATAADCVSDPGSHFLLSHSFLPFFPCSILLSTMFFTCISLKACLIRWEGVKHGHADHTVRQKCLCCEKEYRDEMRSHHGNGKAGEEMSG